MPQHSIYVKAPGSATGEVFAARDSDCVRDVLGCVPYQDCYVLNQGKVARYDTVLVPGETYTICLRMRGGKGGFGSMLRAIGAQIEKTTNREACRDLSGRRMRDVNNEKKMIEFIEKKAEQEREREKKKMEKLERLTQDPKHFFSDPEYDSKVHEAVENVDKAVEKGMVAHIKKRKMKDTLKEEPKLKKGLWLEEDELSSDDSESDSEIQNQALKSNLKSHEDVKANPDAPSSSKATDISRNSIASSTSECKDPEVPESIAKQSSPSSSQTSSAS